MARKPNSKKKKKKKSNNSSNINCNHAAINTNMPLWTSETERARYAALGCHIAHVACMDLMEPSGDHVAATNVFKTGRKDEVLFDLHAKARNNYPWLLGIELFDPSEYDPEDIEVIPEVAVNDGSGGDDMTLTVTNVTPHTVNVCFVSVYDVDLCDGQGNILTSGWTSTNSKKRKCTTFIILCPPQTFVHLCSLAPRQSQANNGERLITSWSQVDIDSDVQPWSYHPHINDEHPYLLHFPFHGLPPPNATNANDTKTPHNDPHNIPYNNPYTPTTLIPPNQSSAYLCTQSENGNLTHFFHGNYHAIDFACPIGTPLYSPVNGVVVEVRDNAGHKNNSALNTGQVNDEPIDGDALHVKNNMGTNSGEVSGVAARNLFHWNSIMICADVNDVHRHDNSCDLPSSSSSSSSPLYVEYVHIQSHSCIVQVGDVVHKGQHLCNSGSVGFSPEPHLHLAAYRSKSSDAATVRVRFECCLDQKDEDTNEEEDHFKAKNGRNSFLPRAGGWYDSSGLVED